MNSQSYKHSDSQALLELNAAIDRTRAFIESLRTQEHSARLYLIGLMNQRNTRLDQLDQKFFGTSASAPATGSTPRHPDDHDQADHVLRQSIRETRENLIGDGATIEEVAKIDQILKDRHGDDFVRAMSDEFDQQWQTSEKARMEQAMNDIHGGNPEDEGYCDASAA